MAHDADDSGEKKPINVIDRRRFEADGAERQESSPSEQHQHDAKRTPESEQRATQPDNHSTEEYQDVTYSGGDVSFMSFIMSLATQALVQLGEMSPPPGMEIPIDRVAAQQTIDILSMLQKKTAGNLSGDEVRFFEEVLHSLRMSYVRSAR